MRPVQNLLHLLCRRGRGEDAMTLFSLDVMEAELAKKFGSTLISPPWHSLQGPQGGAGIQECRALL